MNPLIRYNRAHRVANATLISILIYTTNFHSLACFDTTRCSSAVPNGSYVPLSGFIQYNGSDIADTSIPAFRNATFRCLNVAAVATDVGRIRINTGTA